MMRMSETGVCVYKEPQGLPADTRSKAARDDSPLQLSEGTRPCSHLDFTGLALRPERKYISVFVSHVVCGSLLWKP